MVENGCVGPPAAQGQVREWGRQSPLAYMLSILDGLWLRMTTLCFVCNSRKTSFLTDPSFLFFFNGSNTFHLTLP